MTSKLLLPEVVPNADVAAKMEWSKEAQAAQYNEKARYLPPIDPGTAIRMKRPNEQEWSPAVCIRPIAPQSYVVESGGKKYRRNRRQLRMTGEKLCISPRQPNVQDEDDPSSQQPGDSQDPNSTPSIPESDSQKEDHRPSHEQEEKAKPTPVKQPPTGTVPAASPKQETRSGRQVHRPVRFDDYDMT